MCEKCKLVAKMMEAADMKKVNEKLHTVAELTQDLSNGEVVLMCSSLIVTAALSFKQSPEGCLELYHHLLDLLLAEALEGSGEILKQETIKSKLH